MKTMLGEGRLLCFPHRGIMFLQNIKDLLILLKYADVMVNIGRVELTQN